MQSKYAEKNSNFLKYYKTHNKIPAIRTVRRCDKARPADVRPIYFVKCTSRAGKKCYLDKNHFNTVFTDQLHSITQKCQVVGITW